jgi:uncharacterized protein DUF262
VSEHESVRPTESTPAASRRGASSLSSHGQLRTYRYLTITVREAVDLAATGVWQLPDFQRQFVWQPYQVCELADSLWCDYPIGALLLWLARDRKQDAKRVNGGMIADGLHRLTSLCFLFGREPQWLRSKTSQFRREVRRSFAVYFDVAAINDRRFLSADSYEAGRPGLVPLESLLAPTQRLGSQERRVLQLASDLYSKGVHPGLDRNVIAERLRRVAAIGYRELLVTAISCDRDEAIEIFQRLNSRGMKFRRLLLKFAMQGISGSLHRLRVRRRDRSYETIGR